MVVSRGVMTLSCNWGEKPQQEVRGEKRRKRSRMMMMKMVHSRVKNLSPEDEERSADDDERWEQNFEDEAAGEDAVSDVTGRFLYHLLVHRLHPQTVDTTEMNTRQRRRLMSLVLNISHDASVPLSWRSVHDDVDPQNLHSVQGIWEVHQRRQGDEGQCCDAPGDQRWDTGSDIINITLSLPFIDNLPHPSPPSSCVRSQTHVLSWNRTKFLMLL